MERGPMALFGAIIAVGLGPALWLGAQWGELPALTPTVPVTNVVEQDPLRAPGGEGAADTGTVADQRPARGTLRSTRSAEPARIATRPVSPSPAPTTGAPVEEDESRSPQPSAEPSAPAGPNPSEVPSPSAGSGPSAAAVPSGAPLLQVGVRL